MKPKKSRWRQWFRSYVYSNWKHWHLERDLQFLFRFYTLHRHIQTHAHHSMSIKRQNFHYYHVFEQVNEATPWSWETSLKFKKLNTFWNNCLKNQSVAMWLCRGLCVLSARQINPQPVKTSDYPNVVCRWVFFNNLNDCHLTKFWNLKHSKFRLKAHSLEEIWNLLEYSITLCNIGLSIKFTLICKYFSVFSGQLSLLKVVWLFPPKKNKHLMVISKQLLAFSWL